MEMMMQPAELHLPSWPSYYHITSPPISSSIDELDGVHGLLDMDIDMADFDLEFLSSNFLPSAEEEYPPQVSDSNPDNISSAVSPSMEQYCLMNLDESFLTSYREKLSTFDEVAGLFSQMGSDEYSPLSSSQQICTTEENSSQLSVISNEEAWNNDVSSSTQQQVALNLPRETTELDNQLSIPHLLKACGEAMENLNGDLVEVILRRLDDKACPKGAALQRLLYYLTQSLDERLDYLTQEARKNHEAAFSAFYQMFPYGRFAHFTANSSILEAVPEDAESICIVDFDMGEGVQWPPLIEDLGKQRQRAIRLISITSQDCSNWVPPLHSFEKTKERLCEHAYSFGLNLKVEEMDMEGLKSEMLKTRTSRAGSHWFAFNCMVGLPHMGRQKSSTSVMEFLKIAQQTIGTGKRTNSRGVITFGDGLGVQETRHDFCGLGSFFENQLGRITALLESMECKMPLHLKEARIAMECLFVAPYVSSLACFETLEERAWRGGILQEMGLEARWLSEDIIAEAKELVGEGDNSLYWISTEGEKENQAVLCFVGAPLVRVSSWS